MSIPHTERIDHAVRLIGDPVQAADVFSAIGVDTDTLDSMRALERWSEEVP